MRIEYRLMPSRAHAVEVVDDETGRRWRMDVRVIGDVTADDGRRLTYQGLSIAGILPRAEMEAALLAEFKRASAQRKDDWLRVSVFVVSFVLTAAIGCHFCFKRAAAQVDLPAPVRADAGAGV